MFCRGALDAYEHGNAQTFAVEQGRKMPATYKDVKHRMSETLKVFQERGVLAQREYGEEVPASVHGAPRTVEVPFIHLHGPKLSLRKPILMPDGAL